METLCTDNGGNKNGEKLAPAIIESSSSFHWWLGGIGAAQNDAVAVHLYGEIDF